MGEIAVLVALTLCCVCGVVMTALRLPGTWLIVITAIGYGWWSDWMAIGPWSIGILAALVVIGEIVELLMSAFVARRVGASSRAAWGGLIGGILGIVIFSVPIPIVGIFIGAVAGCFAGAALAELSVRGYAGHSARVGVFSAAGFVLGTMAKTLLSLVMCGFIAGNIIRSRWEKPAGEPARLAAPDERALQSTDPDESETVAPD